jgi:hypothetical protein
VFAAFGFCPDASVSGGTRARFVCAHSRRTHDERG